LQMQEILSMAPDNEIVMLPIPPDYVNVQIHRQTTWDANDSLLGSEAYVIPVPIAKKRLIVKVRGQNILAKVPALEVEFAITYYKLQGKTLPLLILSVTFRMINGLLPPPENAGLTPFAHLRDLKSDNNFKIWFAGFNENGIWSAERAAQADQSGQLSRKRKGRTTHSTRRSAQPGTTLVMPRNQNEQPLANPINPPTHNTLPSFDRHQNVPGANSNSLSTNQQQLPTASSFFVPFLCAVAGLDHSEIVNVQNQVNAVHNRMWETMVQKPKFGHQYVLTHGNENDRACVNQTLWPWQRLGKHWYIHHNDQEWLLNLERNYTNILFPQNCYHPQFITNTTCGDLLMHHFMDWWNSNNTD
jgi:hypothetical protein